MTSNSRRASERTGPGQNLLIYPSTLESAGRILKIANSLQRQLPFSQTVAVGIGAKHTPESETVGPQLMVVRLPGAALSDRLGGMRVMLFWVARVYLKFRRQNLVAVAAQNVYVMPLAYRLSKKTGALFAYNAHELETETIGAKGLKQKVTKSIERRYIRRADVVSVVNDSIADWYEAEYPGLRRPVVLTNTPIDTGKSRDLRAKFGVPDDALLYVHVGFITGGRNVALILREFAAHPNAHVVFLGDGPMRAEVEAAAKKHANIHWHPPVSPHEVVSYVRGADVGLCLIEPLSLSYRLSTPNKLMESLVAGIPPLCSDLVEAKRLMGPELSERWVLDDPLRQLAVALDRINRSDVIEFQKQWRGMPSWDEQVGDLVEAYRVALIAD